MIEFRNVVFSIGDQAILTNVSFRVTRGQTRVILGPSGSGKSTILRLLMGLWQPDSGSILVNDEDITRVTPERLREIRRAIGIVFQQGALFDSMTVGENVGYTLLEDGHQEPEVEDAERFRHYERTAAEQGLRMRALRRRVSAHDVHRWARTFLDDLAESPAESTNTSSGSWPARRTSMWPEGSLDESSTATCERRSNSFSRRFDESASLSRRAIWAERSSPRSASPCRSSWMPSSTIVRFMMTSL